MIYIEIIKIFKLALYILPPHNKIIILRDIIVVIIGKICIGRIG